MKYLLEGVSEIGAAAVDERVEGWVRVPDPVKDFENLTVSNIHQRSYDIEDEKGQPTECERTHDDSKSF